MWPGERKQGISAHKICLIFWTLIYHIFKLTQNSSVKCLWLITKLDKVYRTLSFLSYTEPKKHRVFWTFVICVDMPGFRTPCHILLYFLMYHKLKFYQYTWGSYYSMNYSSIMTTFMCTCTTSKLWDDWMVTTRTDIRLWPSLQIIW